MAYERQTWTCGETITADKLNHIEEGLSEGGCDCGFSCTESRQTVFDGNVTTTEFGGTYAEYQDYNTIISDLPYIVVTFNGTEYICKQSNRTKSGAILYYKYGAPYDDDTVTYDFSEYPFALSVADYGDSFYISFITPTTGTYSFKIEAIDLSVETTPCFEKAVKSVVGKFVVEFSGTSADHTFAEIKQAYDNGMVIEGVEFGSSSYFVYQLSTIGSSYVGFSRVSTDGSNVYVNQFNIDVTDTVTRSYATLTA